MTTAVPPTVINTGINSQANMIDVSSGKCDYNTGALYGAITYVDPHNEYCSQIFNPSFFVIWEFSLTKGRCSDEGYTQQDSKCE